MSEIRVSWWGAITTYLGYGVLFLFGYLRDLFCSLVGRGPAKPPKGYAPLLQDFESFYVRNLQKRIHDCFARPLASSAGAWVDILEREPKGKDHVLTVTGKTQRCLNLGSYNYLGFGDADSPCRDQVIAAINQYSAGHCSTRHDCGYTELHKQAEEQVARFLGKEDAIIYPMGFGVNSSSIPALFSQGNLIVSDNLNHASIVNGSRLSGAKIVVFKHNDIDNLEQILRDSIANGQPRTHRPWKRIVIMTEGIYSMEGDIGRLKQIVEVKRRYKCYLYVDEAHSIGALGRTGRGICEHTGVDPADVDILMGTFTKSFAAVGGYVSGSRELIDYLRDHSPMVAYGITMSAPCCQQIISTMKIIAGEDGTDLGQRKIQQLKDNSNYLRRRLVEEGFSVLGDYDSPVIPVMLFNSTKIPAFSRECLKEKIAVVVVGFPATPLLLARARICVSAAHSREDIDYVIEKFKDVGDRVHIKWALRLTG